MAIIGYLLGVFGVLLVYRHIDKNIFETLLGVVMLIVGFLVSVYVFTGG